MKNLIHHLTASIIVAFNFIVIAVCAQQDPLYGLYTMNPVVVNPALTGMNNNLTIFTSYRNQWAGFDGSPATVSAGGHMSLHQDKMASGILIVSDHIGENTNTQFTASYAYKLPAGEHQTFSFGLQAGVVQYKVDGSQLLLDDPTDYTFSTMNEVKPVIGAGLALKSDKYLVGLSVPRLVNGAMDVDGKKIEVYNRHYYLMGSYLFFLSERSVLRPSVLLKGVKGAPVSADVNLSLSFDRKYLAGIYTRNLDAFGLMAQIMCLNTFRLSYALEVPTNRSVGPAFITHEVMLSARMAVLSFHSEFYSDL
jgi:type IX secretion system PorP/SprF family membrane protein